MRIMKVVHLHLKHPDPGQQQDTYYGSLPAIYDRYRIEEIGIAYSSLQVAMCGKDYYENKLVTVRRGPLHCKAQRNKRKPKE